MSPVQSPVVAPTLLMVVIQSSSGPVFDDSAAVQESSSLSVTQAWNEHETNSATDGKEPLP